ncbi:hypothetical protein AUJ17_00075 [Candidatus Micrarchaeota archaeon CG1_02_47_40]|nr:MAG: hypothetical protein AUJ17_00075 [Candidatus Micrarchaeota archaeon CG1_02_47_40]
MVFMDKKERLAKIVKADGKCVVVPMDHGVGMGPIEGLEDVCAAVKKVVAGGADAVLVHKGIVKELPPLGKTALIIHMSVSTSIALDGNRKVGVCTVEEALSYGADGVSVHINLGCEAEGEMLKFLGEVSRDCKKFGVPLLAMMYVRGPKVKGDANEIAIAARCAYELGADIVKVNYTGDEGSFAKVCGGVKVPVVMAGGSKVTTRESLQMIKDSIDAGGKGVACGRNVFAHKDAEGMVRAICRLVHEGKGVEEAIREVKE